MRPDLARSRVIPTSRKGNTQKSYELRHCSSFTRPTLDRYPAPTRRGWSGKGQERPSGSALGLRADRLSSFPQADEAQSGALEVVRSGPVCALERPRIDAALWHAFSHWLQGDSRRLEELSPMGIKDSRASGVRFDRWCGSDDRPAGAGVRT